MINLKGKILIILLFIFSCKKYEEGPLISFRSKDKRLVKKWIFESYIDLNKNIEYDYGNDKDGEIFTKDGRYEYLISNIVANGNWKFDDNKNSVYLKYYDLALPSVLYYDTLNIIRLTNKCLWYIRNKEKIEYHLIPG